MSQLPMVPYHIWKTVNGEECLGWAATGYDGT